MGGKLRHFGKSAVELLALLLLLVGAVLLFFPLAQNAISQASMYEEIGRVQDVQASGAYASAPEAAGVGDADGGSTADLSGARERLEQYNRKVASGEVSISADPFSFEEALGSFGSQGLDDGLVGYLEIPKMDCSLPLYLGSTTEHMAKGATVVSGSSAPLGGASTNCVIAAHRGYRYAAMFRDIEELSLGDQVYVCTLWEKLTYTVVNVKVISPSDTAAVGVQQGRDMVSLLTCHPYGHNYSRYIVECERDESGSVDTDGSAADLSSSQDDNVLGLDWLPLPKLEDYLRIIGAGALLLCAVILLVRRVRASR